MPAERASASAPPGLAARILESLRTGPARVYELAEQLPEPKSEIEGMLRELRARGAVETVQLGDPPVTHWTARGGQP